MESLRPTPELRLRNLSSAPLFELPKQARRVRVPFQFRSGPKLRIRSEKREEFHASGSVGFEIDGSDGGLARVLRQAAAGFTAAAAAAMISMYGCDPPVFAESLTVAFPVSRAREVNTVQRTLVEAWGLIRETFVDPTFNHQDWDQKLQQTMVEMFPLKSADAAYNKISGMLASLGDPFTRIVSPKEYRSFRIGSDGNLQGVGLFINKEPSSGRLECLKCYTIVRQAQGPGLRTHLASLVTVQDYISLLLLEKNKRRKLICCATFVCFIETPASCFYLLMSMLAQVVLSCIEGSPADRAGIHEGDELIEIDGENLSGIDGEAAAERLRGRVGTSVTVKLYRGMDHRSSNGLREVKLSREVIKLSPISSTVISHRSSDGHETRTGYVRLSAFSQNAAAEMENTIHQLEDQGAQSYILDLRNNPGGLVKAGLDVAQIWLDGDETLVNTIDRDGNMLPINMVNGHAITHDPLVVLVNEGSASASEILAGALHDNGRAILVGHKTFGKGKIQSVTELHDGSALFITVAKYLSPALHDIDQVGITPDVQCTPDVLTLPKASILRDKSTDSALESDSCIMVAEHELEIQQSKGTAS